MSSSRVPRHVSHPRSSTSALNLLSSRSNRPIALTSSSPLHILENEREQKWGTASKHQFTVDIGQGRSRKICSITVWSASPPISGYSRINIGLSVPEAVVDFNLKTIELKKGVPFRVFINQSLCPVYLAAFINAGITEFHWHNTKMSFSPPQNIVTDGWVLKGNFTNGDYGSYMDGPAATSFPLSPRPSAPFLPSESTTPLPPPRPLPAPVVTNPSVVRDEKITKADVVIPATSPPRYQAINTDFPPIKIGTALVHEPEMLVNERPGNTYYWSPPGDQMCGAHVLDLIIGQAMSTAALTHFLDSSPLLRSIYPANSDGSRDWTDVKQIRLLAAAMGYNIAVQSTPFEVNDRVDYDMQPFDVQRNWTCDQSSRTIILLASIDDNGTTTHWMFGVPPSFIATKPGKGFALPSSSFLDLPENPLPNAIQRATAQLEFDPIGYNCTGVLQRRSTTTTAHPCHIYKALVGYTLEKCVRFGGAVHNDRNVDGAGTAGAVCAYARSLGRFDDYKASWTATSSPDFFTTYFGSHAWKGKQSDGQAYLAKTVTKLPFSVLPAGGTGVWENDPSWSVALPSGNTPVLALSLHQQSAFHTIGTFLLGRKADTYADLIDSIQIAAAELPEPQADDFSSTDTMCTTPSVSGCNLYNEPPPEFTISRPLVGGDALLGAFSDGGMSKRVSTPLPQRVPRLPPRSTIPPPPRPVTQLRAPSPISPVGIPPSIPSSFTTPPPPLPSPLSVPLPTPPSSTRPTPASSPTFDDSDGDWLAAAEYGETSLHKEVTCENLISLISSDVSIPPPPPSEQLSSSSLPLTRANLQKHNNSSSGSSSLQLTVKDEDEATFVSSATVNLTGHVYLTLTGRRLDVVPKNSQKPKIKVAKKTYLTWLTQEDPSLTRRLSAAILAKM